MQITKVQEEKNGYLVNDSMFVPSDPKNSDFQKIQKWIAEGGEVESFDLFENTKAEKIAEIKSAAASLILAAYPTHKQLNNLLSRDTYTIEKMNLFISQIRTKSNELEAELDLLSDPEAIKNFPNSI